MNLKRLTLCSLAVGATFFAALAPSEVLAANIAPTSYSMPNGDGVVNGGTWNYWDAKYTGSGNKTTDGAALSGGLGKLTDGVVSTSPFYNVSDLNGTGEYVGWRYSNTPNPVITFNFAGSPVIDTISIQMDNTSTVESGVYAPQAILIDGISRSFTPPATGNVGSVSFTGLNLLGNSHTIQFEQASISGGPPLWTFVSEISFAGAVPEPETYAMLLAGLGLIVSVARRRKLKAS